MTPLKQEVAWESWERVKDKGNWCTVSHGGKETVEAAEGNWARMSQHAIVRPLTPL